MPFDTSKFRNQAQFFEYLLPILNKKKDPLAKLFFIQEAEDAFQKAQAGNGRSRQGYKEILFYLDKLKRQVENEADLSDPLTLNEIIIKEKINLPKKKPAGKTALTVTQTAILFNELKHYGGILNYDASSLATLLYQLTGYSEQKLRAALGSELKKRKEKDTGISENVKVIISFLNKILKDLEGDLK